MAGTTDSEQRRQYNHPAPRRSSVAFLFGEAVEWSVRQIRSHKSKGHEMGMQGSRPAGLVAWKSPEDQPMSLAPDADAGGTLDVEIESSVVTMRGKNCRFVWCSVEKKRKEGEKFLAEVEITAPLAQCQINWIFVEAEVNAELDGGGPLQEQSINAQESLGSSSDTGLTNFLKDISSAPNKPFHSQKVAGPLRVNEHRRYLLLLGGILGALVLLAGVTISLRTKDGTLVVTANEPDAEVQVLNESGNVEITRKGATGPITFTVDPGKHCLKVQKDGFNLFTKEFVIEAGGKQAITVKMMPVR
jgi:hypothetical protein